MNAYYALCEHNEDAGDEHDDARPPGRGAPLDTPEVARRTAAVLDRVRRVVPEMEWPVHAPYVDAIREWKAKRNAVVLAHNYQTPEIFHGVADITRRLAGPRAPGGGDATPT